MVDDLENMVIRFDYESTAGIDRAVLESYKNNPELARVTEHIIHARTQYDSSYAFVASVFDEDILQLCRSVQQQNSNTSPLVIVVGIGGSSLGAKAIYMALNQCSLDDRLIFLETVDSDEYEHVFSQIKHAHACGRSVVGIFITKSGTTLETLVNGSALIEVLQDLYGSRYVDHLFVITDQTSPLATWGKKIGCSVVSIPMQVGGRFSVFTAVGLVPLALAGVSVDTFVAGARVFFETLHNGACLADPLVSAALLYEQYKQGFYVHDTFLFSKNLEDLGKWYRQLLGESIGKEHDRQGKRVNVGFIPTVSIGTQDLHSVVQVYLAGPPVTFTTFVTVVRSHNQKIITCDNEFAKSAVHVHGKSYDFVRDCLLKGTQKAYTHYQRPFATVIFPEISAYTLGQYMAFKMCEIVYLSALLNIDPFDQPHVESYKKAAREFMGT